MELAASTIVLLLVSIVILTFATSLTYRVFCSAEERVLEVDSQTERRIERLLSGGGKVAVADNTKTAEAHGSIICGASRDRSALFSLGIKNVHTGDVNVEVEVIPSGGTRPDGSQILPLPTWSDEDIQFFGEGATLTIRPGEARSVPILIRVPPGAPVGQYVFTIKVTRPGGASAGSTPEIYGVQQAYLTVE